VPCRSACPADTDIPGYLEAIYRGDFESAYNINFNDNFFPEVLGRVCSRPCEKACRHGVSDNGDSVSICFSKRAAGKYSNNKPKLKINLKTQVKIYSL
jgi:formate dehydrogenase major subunit